MSALRISAAVIIAGVAGIAALLVQRTANAVAVTPGDDMSGTPRGIRNNNPFNLIDNGITWRGIIGSDGRYLVFDSPINGIRAGAYNMRTAIERNGNDTIRSLINQWAPPTENLTGEYAVDVSQRSNIGLDETLVWSRDVFALSVAMIQHENGIQPYTAEQIRQGISEVPQ